MPVDDKDKVRQLRKMIDFVCDRIRYGDLEKDTALAMVGRTRARAEALIPDRMSLYDMIYGSRFKMLMEQFVRR